MSIVDCAVRCTYGDQPGKPAHILKNSKLRRLRMRYMMIVNHREGQGNPPQELIDAIQKLAEEETRAGIMLGNGGLAPTALGARVRLSGGKVSVTDGRA